MKYEINYKIYYNDADHLKLVPKYEYDNYKTVEDAAQYILETNDIYKSYLVLAVVHLIPDDQD